MFYYILYTVRSKRVENTQIFGRLLPLDLLHLARTTRAFRRVLMHKSSIFVWKAARENVSGIPDCPTDLSEPQWANLAFDTHCHVRERKSAPGLLTWKSFHSFVFVPTSEMSIGFYESGSAPNARKYSTCLSLAQQRSIKTLQSLRRVFRRRLL